MKKLYVLCSLLAVFFTLNTAISQNSDGRITCYARLSGAQEVPAVVTKAKGLITLTLFFFFFGVA